VNGAGDGGWGVGGEQGWALWIGHSGEDESNFSQSGEAALRVGAEGEAWGAEESVGGRWEIDNLENGQAERRGGEERGAAYKGLRRNRLYGVE